MVLFDQCQPSQYPPCAPQPALATGFAATGQAYLQYLFILYLYLWVLFFSGKRWRDCKVTDESLSVTHTKQVTHQPP